ncbi:FtsH protease activity modulator HflK [Sphingomonas sp.]|uniref:FtsH protease activity modulator HflK n=1 Tax=Sphingomonas sp. TaxID=28214 RepID=UPI0017B58040|nr:FtsH protease activity modulator HflK [Sphingomonas sp.]MBA3510714.1 FtsH protease activity modulator HflK [Sphingomonas sp.]
MSIFSGLGARARGLFADNKGPWGPAGGNGGDEPPSSEGGRGGPWGEPPKRGRRSAIPPPGGNVASLEDFLRRSRARFGDGGGGFPGRPDRSMIMWGLLAFVLLWLLFTSMHRIAPEERGVVTQFGRYNRTLGPGISLTLPSPIERVQKVDIENIRNIDLGSTNTETLMLTGDQNIIDIAYSVRWNIHSPELYLFQLANPEEAIRQVGESAMRAVVSGVSLNDAIGEGRGDIESQVTERMQQILNAYRAGVRIQGVAIKQADPPQTVNDAFKEVSAAQQEAQSYINQARAYALQLTAKAQGEAQAFDRIYEQYRLAPEVTRRRMYYETMERVLANVDKTIVEAPGITPYLPLNQVQRSAPRAEPTP